jgi:peptidoglycan/LPS O-acetylase OafA/YrhL
MAKSNDFRTVHSTVEPGLANSRLYSIDLLRGYAALLVCAFHITAGGQLVQNPQLSAFMSWGGGDGVCLFFIISGFVIPFALFNGRYVLSAFPRFMAKRMMRLEPPYLISIAVALALWFRFKFSAGGPPLDILPATAVLHLGYLINLARYFGATVDWYVPVYWSLAYELQYYVCIALLFPVVASNVRLVRICSVLLLIAAKYGLMAYPLFLKSAEYFAFGIVLFQRRVGLSSRLEYATLALLLIGCMTIDDWRFAIYGPLVAMVFISMNINWGPGRLLGLISYSLYLTHDTFGSWLRGALITKLGLGVGPAIILAIIASIAFAAVFYWLIERPSLILSKHISYVRRRALIGVATTAAGGDARVSVV